MYKLNKMVMGFAAIAVVSTVAMSAPVWAQSAPDAGNSVEQRGPGRGERGDRGDRANVIDRAVVKDVVATALNMTVEELDAAKDAGQTWEEIATAQGVALEDVVAAAKASMTAQVNQALTDGTITQEQADRMLERIAAMDSLDQGHGRGGKHGARGDHGDRANVIDRAVVKDVVATALNMTVEELDAAKDAGQTWEEIATAQGVALEDVVAAAKASMTAQVSQALTDGTITQEQADRMLERIANMDSLGGGRGGKHDGATDETPADTTPVDEAPANEANADDGSTESVARGSTAFATSSLSFAATDVIFLPTVVGGQN